MSRRREARLIEARNRVQHSDQEKSVIERYVSPYTQLEHAGIVGDEQRISWIDALRTANSEADLYGVEYELGPQQAYSFDERGQCRARSRCINRS